MKKSMIITILVIVALAIAFVALYKKPYKIVETRDFSCPGMEGFTFKYPVFEGWEVSLVHETAPSKCEVLLTDPLPGKKAAEYQPRIVVTKTTGNTLPNLTLTNPQGVKYAGDVISSMKGQPPTSANQSATFYSGHTVIKVELLAVGEDFPRKQFWKTMIESFRFDTTVSDLDKSLNKKVVLYGVAEDAKGGAVIRPEQSGYPHSVSIEVVYIENLDFWPEDLVGQTVQVDGVLRKKKYIPDASNDPNARSQGALGEQYVLENATWKIIGK